VTASIPFPKQTPGEGDMKTLRLSFIVGVSLLTGGLLLFHPIPANDAPFFGVMDQRFWWLTLHLIHAPLFAMIGLAAFLLLNRARAIPTAIGGVALFVFAVSSLVGDALAGIATGILMYQAAGLPVYLNVILDGAARALARDPFAWLTNLSDLSLGLLTLLGWAIGMVAIALSRADPSKARLPVEFAVSIYLLFAIAPYVTRFLAGATLAWLLGNTVGAIALAVALKPRAPVFLLAISGSTFGFTHVPPVGPFGLACLAAAAVLLELKPVARRAAPVQGLDD
jgi:hypothetical protein